MHFDQYLKNYIEDLQKPTMSHFEGNFIITNLSKCLEVLRPMILPPDLKTPVQILSVHPLHVDKVFFAKNH